jgi:hypothetical protein
MNQVLWTGSLVLHRQVGKKRSVVGAIVQDKEWDEMQPEHVV